ncbi:olfactory receptor 1f45-like [Dendropsophus ebraccatus]|uniref:olfactory receptor 1f45-like n=1 Tax=Dendropsophus ebraccatus TaxID=150705 RepID=UPI00383103AE
MSNLMDNRTYTLFHLVPFSPNPNDKFLFVSVFSTIYLSGVILNSLVIAVISLDANLHTPMYLFFCTLSTIDIFCTTVIVPKLLHILLSGNGLVTFTQCFTQMYFLFVATSAEVLLLFIMGYDRYVAICHPLHYHQILSLRNCSWIMVFTLVCAFINPSFFILALLNLTFDRLIILHQFFCDSLSVFNASYGGSNQFYIVVWTEWILLGLCPFFFNVVSYINIFCVIVRIKSRRGRRKTFSTCSSHLIVMMIYYSTGATHTISTFYHTGILLNQVLSMIYTTIVPMINPLVYSLRNNEFKKALRRLLKVK